MAMRKIRISLPQELVEFADRVANQAALSRSQVISQAFAKAQARNKQRLASDDGEVLKFNLAMR